MTAEESRRQVTELLGAVGSGDDEALEELTALVYDELRRLARIHMRSERSDHTLKPTALVHEAFFKLLGRGAAYRDRQHFYSVASLTMRRMLMNWARDRKRQKRGGGAAHTPLSETIAPDAQVDPDTILAVDAALGRLAKVSDRAEAVVQCRYFGGLTIDETAEALEVSAATVKREWLMARAWLQRELAT